MNNIARSKLFMIGGGIILSLLVVAIVIIAIFIPREAPVEPEQKTTEEIQEDNINKYYAGENENEEAADIIGDEGDAPPANMYENSYEDDYGYISVADHESAKSNPENTVYDDVWASQKWAELNCDLTNKRTISEKALRSMKNFRDDLTHVASPMSRQLITNVDHIMSKLENSRGQRMPGEVKNITAINCNDMTEEVGL